MKLLLDTHALYLYVEGDRKLSATARTLIQDNSNQIFFSPITLWEIAIKLIIGKWVLNSPYQDFIRLAMVEYGFQLLPIEAAHAKMLIDLGFPPNHKDPFDRMRVVQAMA